MPSAYFVASGKGSRGLHLGNPPSPVEITSVSPLPDATDGNLYSFQFQRSGGTGIPAWSITAGSLPSGLSLSSGGLLSGTPDTLGSYSFTVTVIAGSQNSKPFALDVIAASIPQITTASPLPDATQNVAYSLQFEYTGGSGVQTWSVIAGSLPTGLALSSGGLLSGTPTVPGPYSFTVQVSDAAGSDSDVFALTVDAAPVAPEITSTSPLPDATKDSAYSFQFEYSGGSGVPAWSVIAGALPAGLSLSSVGLLSGTPTVDGPFAFTVQITDDAGSDSELFTLEVVGFWTVFTPSVDTLQVFVSNSDGNDSNDGLSSLTPKKTIVAGMALLQSGRPDWLLLKAGDTFTNQRFVGWNKSGRSVSERMLISSYGTGVRPIVLSNGAGINAYNTPVSHLAIVGIDFAPNGYTGSQGWIGVDFLAVTDDLLVEDCRIVGYTLGFRIQAFTGGPGTITNVKLRRDICLDSWANSGSSHSQGFYAEGVNGLLAEECIFDHNGWNLPQPGGQATIFNHNTYFSECDNVTTRGNMFLRGSSMGNKYRSDSTGAFNTVLIENNFYLENEIAIGIGGNTAQPLRFTGVTIRNNVMIHIGRSEPTGRAFGWYLDLQDWDGTLIEGNVFSLQPLFSNSFGINLNGSSERNVTILQNVFYKIQEQSILATLSSSEANILVDGNDFQDPTEGSHLVDFTGSFAKIAFQNNRYYSPVAPSGARFQIGGVNKSYAEWVAESGETGSSEGQVTYPDPDRDEVTYMASIGETPTTDAFIAACRAQSKANWDARFSALAINDYIRAGFGL